MNMKMLFTKCRGHKAPKVDSATNPLNELTLAQLYDVWSSTDAASEEHKTEEVFQRIKSFVEAENLAKHPIHLMRALIRFTSTCNDYVFQCVEGQN
jgi:hypothetical protein